MIKLHHLNNSRSQRLLWALEEIGLPYEIIRYERDPKTMFAPDSLKKVHPLGKAPVLVDGEITLAESGAIIEYLLQTHGNQFLPEQSGKAYQNYLYWMHYAEGSLMPYLLLKLVFEKVKTSPMPFFVRPIAKAIADKATSTFIGPNLDNHLKFINQHLSQNEWFAGDQLTGADFQMSFPLEACVARGIANQQHPHIVNYVKRFQSRPAYQQALEKGGKYDYA
ncbi:glutathione S-transferase family protein [Litoribrevibacter euphylliae]|uniref:Glutathione S-transferase family protein n=1 Tax=Litoribrevibacter euphylliae TaxID=1834034 RepID=A0ABV7HH53_9GAMM